MIPIQYLLFFVVAELKPAPLKKVFEQYRQINHINRKIHCSGLKPVRRRAEVVEQYNDTYPAKDLDYNSDLDSFLILCDHLPCDNVNAEVEFAISELAKKNNQIKLAVEECRPLSLLDKDENPTRSPKYGKLRLGCRYCYNFSKNVFSLLIVLLFVVAS